MADGVYRIIDEPAPGALGHLTVNPLWPLLGLMLAGGWLAWPWFILNAFALGSPTRFKETSLVVLGIAGTAALAFGLFLAFEAGYLDRTSIKYAILILPVWKIGIGYYIYLIQAGSFGIYEYYGGLVRPGIVVVIAGFFLREHVLDLLPENLILLLTLS